MGSGLRRVEANPAKAEAALAAALLLDAWALLDRADLRAGEETLRRWLAAAASCQGSRWLRPQVRRARGG